MYCVIIFFFQAEDGIRDLVRSRGLGDVYKRQVLASSNMATILFCVSKSKTGISRFLMYFCEIFCSCLLYTSDAADERSSVDLGGRRIIKKKTKDRSIDRCTDTKKRN